MTETLHIGQFITQYPYAGQFDRSSKYFCSGAERVAKSLSESLVAEGCKITVCTSSATRRHEIESQGDITVRRSASLGRINTTQIAPTQLLDPFMQDTDIDIVHAHNSTPPGVIAGWIYAKWHDVPLVITHHGGENYESHGSLARRIGLSLYTNVLINPLFQSAEATVSPTAGYVNESSALSNADAVTVIPNGVDTAQFELSVSPTEAKRRLGLDPESFLVLYIGSLHPRKGVDVLLDGFLQFHCQHPDSHLVIGGDGEQKNELKSVVANRDASTAVDITGFVPESKKPLYMTAADVFVLPSVTPGAEVFPLVLLEAAAARTPLMASDFDTIASIVEPSNCGVLLDPDSAQSITDTLAELYHDDSRHQTLTNNAHKMANEHEWPRIAEQYESLYRDLLNRA